MVVWENVGEFSEVAVICQRFTCPNLHLKFQSDSRLPRKIHRAET